MVAVLQGIGYRVIPVDASRGSLSDCLQQIESEVPEWPAPYVTGLDGLNDGLRDLEGRAFAFVLRGYESLHESEPDAAIELLNSLASGAWWQMTQGRPLLTLVETNLPVAVRVGALPVVTWRGWWEAEDQGRA